MNDAWMSKVNAALGDLAAANNANAVALAELSDLQRGVMRSHGLIAASLAFAVYDQGGLKIDALVMILHAAVERPGVDATTKGIVDGLTQVLETFQAGPPALDLRVIEGGLNKRQEHSDER